MGKIMRNGNKYSCASPNNAQSVVYDNTTSGLEAENTKEAIDELSSKIDEQNKKFNEILKVETLEKSTNANGIMTGVLELGKPIIGTLYVSVDGVPYIGIPYTNASSWCLKWISVYDGSSLVSKTISFTYYYLDL